MTGHIEVVDDDLRKAYHTGGNASHFSIPAMLQLQLLMFFAVQLVIITNHMGILAWQYENVKCFGN